MALLAEEVLPSSAAEAEGRAPAPRAA